MSSTKSNTDSGACAQSSCQADAVKAVREKYDEIMMLFDRYNGTGTKDERETIINEVSSCINHLTSVEDKDVYPIIRTQSNPEGLDICEETHSQVRLVLDKLMRLCADIDKKDYESEVEKLREAVRDMKAKDENLFASNKL